MFDGSVTSNKDEIRRTLVVFEAHNLSRSSRDLAIAADRLSLAARAARDSIDIDEVEGQLSEVRRGCAEVTAGVDHVGTMAHRDIDSAESLIRMAKDVFDRAEH